MPISLCIFLKMVRSSSDGSSGGRIRTDFTLTLDNRCSRTRLPQTSCTLTTTKPFSHRPYPILSIMPSSSANHNHYYRPFITLTLCLFLLLHLPSFAHCHGMLLYPNSRGALNPKSPFSVHPIPAANDSAIDYFLHFPAGPKLRSPGSAYRYQRRHTGTSGWVPYNPFDPSFRLRAGLCGDALNNRDHLRGGKYFDNHRISATFTQGSVIDLIIGISTHHNGFIQVYLCDVAKCNPNDDISRSCFVDGHCKQLIRSTDADEDRKCEKGDRIDCAPCDPKYPGRWYLPCESNGRKRWTYTKRKRYVTYGPGSIRYKLPEDVNCEHCVLQWHWTTANNCNPPGVVDFFKGPRRPRNWQRCKGQGGAKGGYTTVQQSCGSKKQPEEYYSCSDIRIAPRKPKKVLDEKDKLKESSPSAPPPPSTTAIPTAKAQKPAPTPTSMPTTTSTSTLPSRGEPTTTRIPIPTRTPTPTPTSTRPSRTDGLPIKMQCTADNDPYKPRRGPGMFHGTIQDVILLQDGRRTQSLRDNIFVNYDASISYSLEVYTSAFTTRVHFQVYDWSRNGILLDGWQRRPPLSTKRFFMLGRQRGGSGCAVAWKHFPIGRLLTVRIAAETMDRDVRGGMRLERDQVYVQFLA